MTQQEIIEKMRQAYDEFAKYMEKLSREGDDLVKENLRAIEKEKIATVLNQIKSIGGK